MKKLNLLWITALILIVCSGMVSAWYTPLHLHNLESSGLDEGTYRSDLDDSGTPVYIPAIIGNGARLLATPYLVNTSYANVTASRTFDFWLNDSESTADRYFWTMGPDASNRFLCANGDTGLLTFYIPAWGGLVTTSSALNKNVWYHVVLVLSPTNGAKLYINGVLNASNAGYTAVPTASFNALRIGSNFDGSKPALQEIDNFAIFEEEYSQANVTASFNLGAGTNFLPIIPPPVISDTCCLSPDPDSCSEPYDTSGDLTPTFNFTTDLEATCYIGDDNATWTVCSTTTVAGEHICTEPATHPLVFGADKVYLNCSSEGGDTYDELNVASSYLAGNVTDSSDRLISGALVTVSKNNTINTWDSNVTDVNGYWVIGVSPNFYTICAYDPDNITLRGDCTPFVEAT